MLERDAGNPELARELFKCAVKADPKSEPSWLVRCCLGLGMCGRFQAL